MNRLVRAIICGFVNIIKMMHYFIVRSGYLFDV